MKLAKMTVILCATTLFGFGCQQDSEKGEEVAPKEIEQTMFVRVPVDQDGVSQQDQASYFLVNQDLESIKAMDQKSAAELIDSSDEIEMSQDDTLDNDSSDDQWIGGNAWAGRCRMGKYGYGWYRGGFINRIGRALFGPQPGAVPNVCGGCCAQPVCVRPACGCQVAVPAQVASCGGAQVSASAQASVGVSTVGGYAGTFGVPYQASGPFYGYGNGMQQQGQMPYPTQLQQGQYGFGVGAGAAGNMYSAYPVRRF